MTADSRLVEAVKSLATAIESQWQTYDQNRRDYQRGGLPANSMPDYSSGTREPPTPELDKTDERLMADYKTARAALLVAKRELEKVWRSMLWVNQAVDRIPDPEPVYCANVNCPDGKMWTMLPGDRPQRSDRRCEACHKYQERNGRERTTMRAEVERATKIIEQEESNA